MSDEKVVKKRLAIIGSKTFSNKQKVYDILTKNLDRIKCLVTGGMAGADSIAIQWANDYGVPYLMVPALWRNPDTGEFNKGAAMKQQRKIIEYADTVIAFWDGQSVGTATMINMAQRLNKRVIVKTFSTEQPKPPVQDVTL